MIKVGLPAHLRTLAGVDGEVEVDLEGDLTIGAVLDHLEARFRPLKGTMRDQATGKRRPFVRFFAGENDVSHDPYDTPLPESVASGRERFTVVGAMAGG